MMGGGREWAVTVMTCVHDGGREGMGSYSDDMCA